MLWPTGPWISSRLPAPAWAIFLHRFERCSIFKVLGAHCCQWTNIYEPQCDKMYNLTCAPSEGFKRSAHPHSLIRVCVVNMERLCILGYPKYAPWRFWSDLANVQVDLILIFAHMSEGLFYDHTSKSKSTGGGCNAPERCSHHQCFLIYQCDDVAIQIAYNKENTLTMLSS